MYELLVVPSKLMENFFSEIIFAAKS